MDTGTRLQYAFRGAYVSMCFDNLSGFTAYGTTKENQWWLLLWYSFSLVVLYCHLISLFGKWLTWILCMALPMEIPGKLIASTHNIIHKAHPVRQTSPATERIWGLCYPSMQSTPKLAHTSAGTHFQTGNFCSFKWVLQPLIACNFFNVLYILSRLWMGCGQDGTFSLVRLTAGKLTLLMLKLETQVGEGRGTR
jgi:hypothetical protein